MTLTVFNLETFYEVNEQIVYDINDLADLIKLEYIDINCIEFEYDDEDPEFYGDDYDETLLETQREAVKNLIKMI